MARWVVALLVLAGCDTVWRIDHIPDAPTTPTFVQSAWKADADGINRYASYSVAFDMPQLAGDLDIIAICWATSPGIDSVTDTNGNTYQLAAPSTQVGNTGQSIYYAESIAAGANTLTVTFNSSGTAVKPDVRVAEYAGARASNALDAMSADKAALSAALDSGSLSTTALDDLLVAASCAESDTDPLPNFVQRAATTNGNVLADSIAGPPGDYMATGTLKAPSSWVLQIVAFKAAVQR
jgi:hypothetical protein